MASKKCGQKAAYSIVEKMITAIKQQWKKRFFSYNERLLTNHWKQNIFLLYISYIYLLLFHEIKIFKVCMSKRIKKKCKQIGSFFSFILWTNEVYRSCCELTWVCLLAWYVNSLWYFYFCYSKERLVLHF